MREKNAAIIRTRSSPHFISLEPYLKAQLCVRRSSEWGVMPAHWYFSSALPRALLGALPLALVGVVLERRVRPTAAIAVAFVALYSFLPHKEVGHFLLRLPYPF